MSNYIPQLSTYAQSAYNAKNGDFLGASVFNLTYTKGQSIEWGPSGQDKSIPDQITAVTDTNFYDIEKSVLLENQQDYDNTFSSSVDAEYSGVTYSGSMQSSLLYHGNLFTSSSSTYALNFYLQSVLKFKRQADALKASINSQFAADMRALPGNVDTQANLNAYFAFFDAYGTHYLDSATIGGTVVMETEINDSVYKSSTKLEVSTAVSGGYKGIVASAKFNAKAAYSSSKFLEQHENDISVSLHVMGGLYTQDGTFANWLSSIYNTPVLLLNAPKLKTTLTSFKCISALVAVVGADSAIKSNIEAALLKYIILDDYQDGLLTSPKTLDFGRVYDSKGMNGFIIATVQEVTNGNRGYIKAYNDSNENPTIIRATASQHYYTSSDTQVPSASLTMPTPANTWFLAEQTPTSGNPSFTLTHIGFSDFAQKGTGSWTSITFGQTQKATSDGFVVAYIDWNNNNGARGYITGSQDLNSSGNLTQIAGSSQHFYTDSDSQIPTNSFCMPVRNNTNYCANFTATSGTPVANAFFISLAEPLIFFDTFQPRNANRMYTATSDGFLLVFLNAATNGDRGYVNISTGPSSLDDSGLNMLASTSVHYYSGNDTWVPLNTAMVPVSKNNSYIANFQATSGNPIITLLWIPLGINTTTK